jgi:ABC-type antimicrobial peptide transport system permease subunit
MLLNYWKIAIRNLRSIYSLINIVGLTIGLTAFVLVFCWVDDELSYDRFHKDNSRIFRVYQERQDAQGNGYAVALTPALLHDYISANFSSVENVCRLVNAELLLRNGEKAFYQKGFSIDPSFFSIFSFPLVSGSITNFDGTDKIILTEKSSSIFFGKEDPIGKSLKIAGRDFFVVAVARNFPSNSHLQTDFLFPLQTLKTLGWETLDQWDVHRFHTYVKIKHDDELPVVAKQIKDLLRTNTTDRTSSLLLQPLANVYLHSSKINNDMPGRGDIQYVYIFSAVGVFILLVACINFTNLATARSVKRAKEAGVRKVVGAERSQLVFQFFSESAFYTVLAVGFAIGLSWWLLPKFSEISGKTLQLELASGHLLLMIVGATLFCVLVSGIYPALFLSSLKPIVVFKGVLKAGKLAVIFRRSLVVFQFTLGIALVVCTLVVYHQLDYIRSRDLGYQKENLITFHITRKLRSQYTDFKNELAALPGVAAVTVANSSLSFSDQSADQMEWEGKDPGSALLFHQFMVDHDFVKTFGMTISQGRDFSIDLATDSLAVLLNEEAVRQMNLSNPVGKTFTVYNRKPGNVIGVIKDFNFKSVHKKIEPAVIYIDPENYSEVTVRLKKGTLEKSIADVSSVFKKFSPDRPFEFIFLDQEIDKLYKVDQRTGKLFNIFSALSIFISCLGLLGVVMFTTEQRMKEFAIRKTLGASTPHLFMNVSKEFLILVAIANIIGLPLSSYAMKLWLERFAYFDPAPWILYVSAALISVLVTWLTIAYFSIKVAVTSPVNALKSE